MANTVRVKAELCLGRDLKPGELFSTAGPDYWSNFSSKDSVGARVYVRTCTSPDAVSDADETVYRITIETVEKDLKTDNRLSPTQGVVATCEIEFQAIGRVVQTVEIIDPDWTVDRIRAGLIDGKVLTDATKILSDSDEDGPYAVLVETENGKTIGNIVLIENDVEAQSFAVRESQTRDSR